MNKLFLSFSFMSCLTCKLFRFAILYGLQKNTKDLEVLTTASPTATTLKPPPTGNSGQPVNLYRKLYEKVYDMNNPAAFEIVNR